MTVQWYLNKRTCASRFVLQPGAVSEESRLAAQLGQLRSLSMNLEAAQYLQTARDFADVLLRSEDQLFRCLRLSAGRI